jgi:hypothetical protein
MHLTMECAGPAESAMPRLRRTAPRAVGERLEDDENADGDGGSEAEKRRADEFERSGRGFDGRKERVEQIMGKVRCATLYCSLSATRWGLMIGVGAAVGRALEGTCGISRARYASGQLCSNFPLHDRSVYPDASSHYASL